MNEVFFLVQVKHTNGVYEKGVVVKETLDAVLQSYHAYLGAYAYGHDTNTDYVYVAVIDDSGLMRAWEKYDARPSANEEE